MSKFHINYAGEPGPCLAKPDNCPFGDEEHHYPSEEVARFAYESEQNTFDQEIKKAIYEEYKPTWERMDRQNARIVLDMSTIHGSHLYGLSRPGSDVDYYRVVVYDVHLNSHQSMKTQQTIVDGDDRLIKTLSSFLDSAQNGVPQALETMFSPYLRGPMEPYFRNYMLDTGKFANTYRRTIRNFARFGVDDERATELLRPTPEELASSSEAKASAKKKKPNRINVNGMAKYRRHSVRLMLNYEQGLEYGVFSPVMEDWQKRMVFEWAEMPDEMFAEKIMERVQR